MTDINYFLVLFIGMVVISGTIIILWHILHFILCHKYDASLFKEPYFRPTELGVYSSWPMSLFRSMGYISYVALPGLSIRRRFKDRSPDKSNGIVLVFVCRLFLFMILIGVLSALSLLVWGALV